MQSIFLSYLLDSNITAYGNGDRIDINITHDQDNGDSCNGSKLMIPTHFGTHIDLGPIGSEYIFIKR